MRIALCLAIAASTLALSATVPAQSQANGPFVIAELGQSFGSLQEAVNAIGEGQGTIQIAPGRYSDCAVQGAGRVTFVATQPGKAVFAGGICEEKATLVLRGQSSRVDGLVFTGLSVPDGNGSGIRIEQGKLDVMNSTFVDSQGGILSAQDSNGTVNIDHCTFSGLGKRPDGNGAHSVYIGKFSFVRVTNTRFERGRGGHYLKIRAPKVEILGNSFDDSQGRETNYSIDLSNGATGRIAGNSFEVGPNKENWSTQITIAPEGRQNNSTGLIVENNRAWASPGFREQTTLVGNWSDDRVVVRNNDVISQFKEYVDR